MFSKWRWDNRKNASEAQLVRFVVSFFCKSCKAENLALKLQILFLIFLFVTFPKSVVKMMMWRKIHFQIWTALGTLEGEWNHLRYSLDSPFTQHVRLEIHQEKWEKNEFRVERRKLSMINWLPTILFLSSNFHTDARTMEEWNRSLKATNDHEKPSSGFCWILLSLNWKLTNQINTWKNGRRMSSELKRENSRRQIGFQKFWFPFNSWNYIGIRLASLGTLEGTKSKFRTAK